MHAAFRTRWLKYLFAALVPLTLPSFTSAQDTTGSGALRGRVVEENTHRPISDAELCLDNGRCGRTGPDGSFRLEDLRPGDYLVTVGTATAKVHVRAGVEANVEFEVPEIKAYQETVEVSAPVFLAPEELRNSNYLVSAREVQYSASSLKDVSRQLQTLPGVVFGGNDFRNDIVVRGGSPLENLFIVDNIDIPNINHFANFASAGGPVGEFNSELLADMTFLTGGYPAPYDNRLSSVVQISQRDGNHEHNAGQFTLGFGGAGGIAEGPIGTKGSWVVSMRRSFLDAFTKDIGIGGVPIYYNYQGKALYDLTPSDRVWISTIGGWDRIALRPNPDKPDEESTPYNVNTNGSRDSIGVNWQHVFGASGVGLLGVSTSGATEFTEVSDNRLADLITLNQTSSERDVGIKYDLTYSLSGVGRVQAGVSGRWYFINYDNNSPIGYDNPFSQVPGRVDPHHVIQDFTTTQQSGYLQVSRNLLEPLQLTVGLRWDRYAYGQNARLTERAGLTWRIRPSLSAHASFGTYVQQPAFVFLTASPINRSLAPIGARHIVAGLGWTPTGSTRVTVEAYEKIYSDYPVSTEYQQISLAAAGNDYGPNYYLIPMISAGRGRARGIEIFAEKKFNGHVYGEVNLSASQSRQAALDGIMRPSGFDSPYVFNATGGYHVSPLWEVAVRYVFLSGRPYTPYDPTLSQEQDRGVFDLSRVNALRAPSYQRLDFRIDRFLRWHGQQIDVYGGLQNAFNRQNFLAYQWDYRVNQPKELYELKLFPIGGVEWRFP
jgi:hypothetical protein